MVESQRVLVFGGSFNPPHKGHKMMAKEVLTRELKGERVTDQLWFLPVGLHDFGKDCAAASHRLVMTELLMEALIAEEPSLRDRMRIEKSEVRQGGVSYTANTLRYLRSTYPQYQFSFLIGSDNLEKFHMWYDRQGQDYKTLLQEFPFYVYPRVGFPFAPLYENMIPLEGFPELKVSSTEVRAEIKNAPGLTELLDDKVIACIKENDLYQ